MTSNVDIPLSQLHKSRFTIYIQNLCWLLHIKTIVSLKNYTFNGKKLV